jgi:hypothetical protein
MKLLKNRIKPDVVREDVITGRADLIKLLKQIDRKILQLKLIAVISTAVAFLLLLTIIIK